MSSNIVHMNLHISKPYIYYNACILTYKIFYSNPDSFFLENQFNFQCLIHEYSTVINLRYNIPAQIPVSISTNTGQYQHKYRSVSAQIPVSISTNTGQYQNKHRSVSEIFHNLSETHVTQFFKTLQCEMGESKHWYHNELRHQNCEHLLDKTLTSFF